MQHVDVMLSWASTALQGDARSKTFTAGYSGERYFEHSAQNHLGQKAQLLGSEGAACLQLLTHTTFCVELMHWLLSLWKWGVILCGSLHHPIQATQSHVLHNGAARH